MKTLNLVNKESSDVKFELSSFPDGQQNIKILDFQATLDKWNKKAGVYPITIKSRLNSFKDLEKIICAVASLRNLGNKDLDLYVPYFVGARSDRQFEEGGNNYLKQVICPIINSLNFNSVTILDPHSDVLEACLNNFEKVTNYELLRFFRIDCGKQGVAEDCVWISPDAGASKKIYKLAEQLGYKGDIITCSKDRDTEGKLSRTIVPIHGKQHHQALVLIDDICDGGRTFINIIEEIRRQQQSFKTPPNNAYLIVTHGIFSAGFAKLSEYFDGIYCTNSYSDLDKEHITTNSIKSFKTNLLVKQLNVF